MYNDIYLQLMFFVDYVIGHDGRSIVRPERTEEVNKR
jgi:hypothetical protein